MLCNTDRARQLPLAKPPPTSSPELAIGRKYQYSLSECERDVARWEAATEVWTLKETSSPTTALCFPIAALAAQYS